MNIFLSQGIEYFDQKWLLGFITTLAELLGVMCLNKKQMTETYYDKYSLGYISVTLTDRYKTHMWHLHITLMLHRTPGTTLHSA